jgi:hypothetical protein
MQTRIQALEVAGAVTHADVYAAGDRLIAQLDADHIPYERCQVAGVFTLHITGELSVDVNDRLIDLLDALLLWG